MKSVGRRACTSSGSPARTYEAYEMGEVTGDGGCPRLVRDPTSNVPPRA